MKLDALIAFSQASYRNMTSYFTSKFIEHNKNKWKNQDIKNTFTILVVSSSIFIQLHVVCLTFETLLTTILYFLTSEAHFSALQFVFQVGSHSVFVIRTRRNSQWLIWYLVKTSMNFAHFAGFQALSFVARTVPKKIVIFHKTQHSSQRASTSFHSLH